MNALRSFSTQQQILSERPHSDVAEAKSVSMRAELLVCHRTPMLAAY